MENKTKKGQASFGALPAIILGFIIVVVTMSIGAEVQTGARDAIKDTVTYTFTNESFTPVLNITTDISHAKPNSVTLNSTLVVCRADGNASGCMTQGTDYTIFSNGSFVLINATENNTEYNFTFDQTQDEQDDAYNASSDGLTGIDNMSGKLGLLGTVLILGVVIGVVLLSFAFVIGRRGA